MLLTKKKLRIILGTLRVKIPAELEKELLDEYGNLAANDEGHHVEYTEQDIYEQLRKKLHPYEKNR